MKWPVVILHFPSTLPRRNFKTEVQLWRRIKCFPSTLRQMNLKTEVQLWRRIKCFSSTLRQMNLKTEVQLWRRIKCFLSTLRQMPGIWRLRFNSEDALNLFRPHYAKWIWRLRLKAEVEGWGWRLRFNSEDAFNVFPRVTMLPKLFWMIKPNTHWFWWGKKKP